MASSDYEEVRLPQNSNLHRRVLNPDPTQASNRVTLPSAQLPAAQLPTCHLLPGGPGADEDLLTCTVIAACLYARLGARKLAEVQIYRAIMTGWLLAVYRKVSIGMAILVCIAYIVLGGRTC